MDATRNFFPVSRGLSFFLSGFSLLNVVGLFRSRNFDATILWIDLRPVRHGRDLILVLIFLLVLRSGLGRIRCLAEHIHSCSEQAQTH